INSDKDLTFNDFAILARSHDALAPFAEQLEEAQIPFIYFANKGLYRKPLILDIISYFKLLDNYHESQAVYRVLNFPIFHLDHRTVVEINHWANKKALTLFEALKKINSFTEISPEDLNGINKLLTLVTKHSQMAREKSAHQVFIQVFND